MSATDLDDGAGVTRPDVGRIVVGVDGSESSRQALIWGRRLARLLGCEVEAVTVWQVPAVASPSAGWAPLPPDADLAGQAAAKLADTVAAAFDDDPPAELRLCVRHGQCREDARRGECRRPDADRRYPRTRRRRRPVARIGEQCLRRAGQVPGACRTRRVDRGREELAS